MGPIKGVTKVLSLIHEHPLLNVPPGNAFPKPPITDEDIDLMSGSMGKFREDGMGIQLAGMHFYMKALRIGQPLSEEERELMKAASRRYRDVHDDHELAILNYYMDYLGEGRALPVRHMREMGKKVKKAEEDRDPGIAWIHFYQRWAEGETEITEAHKKIIHEGLMKARSEGDGKAVSETLFFMNALGLGGIAGEGDYRLMLDALKRARSEGDGAGVAFLHYHIRNLQYQTEGGVSNTPLPPVKRFQDR